MATPSPPAGGGGVGPPADCEAGERGGMFGAHGKSPMNLRDNYAYATALMGNVSEATAMYEDLVRTSQRVFGPSHPFTTIVRNNLRKVREAEVVYGADPLQG